MTCECHDASHGCHRGASCFKEKLPARQACLGHKVGLPAGQGCLDSTAGTGMVQQVAGQTSEGEPAPTLSTKERRSLCPLVGLQPSLNLHDTRLCLLGFLDTCRSTVRTASAICTLLAIVCFTQMYDDSRHLNVAVYKRSLSSISVGGKMPQ